MADYITTNELRGRIGSDTLNFEDHAQACVTVASRMVERLTDRYFLQDAAASARYFPCTDTWCVDTNDISTTTGLIVATDDGYDGTYSTTWTINTDFTLEPANPTASGTAEPYTSLHATGTRAFPYSRPGRRNTVKVTAKWGWSAVPADVTEATQICAAWLFKLKDAPDGFIGVDGWGPRFYKENPAARILLGPYMRNPIAVA